MPLPTTIATAALWADHKNQSLGGPRNPTVNTDSSDDGTFYNLGDTFDYVSRIAAYQFQAGHKLIRVRCYLQRVGSPSGNVSIEVRPAFTISIPDLTVLWGVSKSVPASSIPTSGKNEIIFSFPVPVTLPTSDTTQFAIILTISAQGDASNYIKVYKGANGSTGSTHAYGASATTWTNTGSTSFSRIVEISKSGALVVLSDKSANQHRLYEASDNSGSSWTARTSVTSNSGTGLKSLNVPSNIHDLSRLYAQLAVASPNLALYGTSMVGDATSLAIDASGNLNFGTFGTNVSGGAPVGGGRRANGNIVMVAQGATETVMGTARRRIKLAFYNGTSWSSIFDVQGSANTPDATLPGDAVHYDLRWAGIDPNGDCHIIYSRSDSSTLQYRKFKSDDTFATINTLNGAVASATANYPVGQPAFYYQSPDWFIAVPYLDNTSNTLKVARCNTTTTTTSANWSLTEIVSASAEVTASNPALLMADNAQGGKLFCWRVVPSTRGLRLTDDGGNNTWKPETDWRGATQQVGGISGFHMEDGIALVYLEEGTTPDEVRYDRL